MHRTKYTNKLVKNLLGALPAIPLLMSRKKASIAPYILGALGIAIIGGMAAVMFLSPRTRQRTLGIAKDGYGKVRGQLGISERLGTHGHRPTTPAASARGVAADNGQSSV